MTSASPAAGARRTRAAVAVLTFAAGLSLAAAASAHAVTEGDKGYIQEISGAHLLPFVYLGAKHMVTGFDHLLFLFGVIFFLYRMKDVALYVTLFAVGHSTTMILGVLSEIAVSAYLVDAVIGFSVVYKALDNLGAFQRWFGWQPDTRAATLIFGFIHGFGLATKLIEYDIAPDGLVPNLIAFNVGVEVGQILALAAILIAMGWWRRSPSFLRHAYAANVAMMTAGFVLMGLQLTGYFVA
jgi:hypothetical protein